MKMKINYEKFEISQNKQKIEHIFINKYNLKILFHLEVTIYKEMLYIIYYRFEKYLFPNKIP